MDKKRIFKRKIDCVELYLGGIELVDKKSFDEAQIGYRCRKDGKPIKEWIGNEYYVIGFDTLLGDPIIVKVDEKSYPVYFMQHDDWENLDKISNSYEDFLTVLGILKKTGKKKKFNNKKIISKIKKIIGEECIDYWDAFLQAEIEYLEENE